MSVEAYPGQADLNNVDGAPCAIIEASAEDHVHVAGYLRGGDPVRAEVGEARYLVLSPHDLKEAGGRGEDAG